MREHGEQHQALQEEVHEHAADRGERQDLARERDLLHEARRCRRPNARRRARSRRGSTRAGPTAGRSGRREHPSRGSSRTRCRRRPGRAAGSAATTRTQDAVLVLDLELLAGHPDEQLVVSDDPPEPLENRGAGPDDTCVARDHAGAAAESGMAVKLADRARVPRVWRHLRRAAEPGPDGGRRASRASTSPEGPIRRHGRARDRSGCAAGCAGYVRPAHGAAPAEQHRHDTADPRSCSRRRGPPCDPRGGSCGASARRWRIGRELPEHRRHVHGNHRRPHAARCRPCTTARSARPRGSARMRPIGSVRRASDREARADARSPRVPRRASRHGDGSR